MFLEWRNDSQPVQAGGQQGLVLRLGASYKVSLVLHPGNLPVNTNSFYHHFIIITIIIHFGDRFLGGNLYKCHLEE